MIDLKELMEDRSAHQPTASHLRLDQVKKRITTRRHRRIAAGAVCAAVVLLLIGGYQLVPTRRTSPPPTPAATPTPTAAAFPEHYQGARLVASQTAPMSQQKVSLTWTPTTLDIIWAQRCLAVPAIEHLMTEMTVNGNPVGGQSCVDGMGSSRSVTPQDNTHLGVRIGETATVTLTVPGIFPNMPTPTAIPSEGLISVAVYERVPFEAYPFPARPDPLKPLGSNRGCYAAGSPNVLRSDPADPLKPMSTAVEWPGRLMYNYQAQTPGFLHIAINGVRVTSSEWWDYNVGDLGGVWDTSSFTAIQAPGWVPPRLGEIVTIAVTPEHLTGAWQFQVLSTEGGVLWAPCQVG